MLFTIGLAGMVCAGLYLDGSIGRKIMRAIVLACAWMYAFWALLVFGSFAQVAGEKYVRDSDPYWQRSYESAVEYQERIDTLETEDRHNMGA